MIALVYVIVAAGVGWQFGVSWGVAVFMTGLAAMFFVGGVRLQLAVQGKDDMNEPWHEWNFTCAYCGAQPGEPCRSLRTDLRTGHHGSRIRQSDAVWWKHHPERRVPTSSGS